MKIEEAYQVMQEASGIKVGDTVKVLRKAEAYEMGWCNSWAGPMSDMVGKTATVNSVTNGNINLGKDNYGYPFFVLEIVEKKFTCDETEEQALVLLKKAAKLLDKKIV